MINADLTEQFDRQVIRSMTGRIKQTDSIAKKADAKRKRSNISGCGRYFKRYCRDPRRLIFFVMIFTVWQIMSKKQKDITLLKEKDYVKNPKKSGYQSIHLIVGIPVTYLEKTKEIRVEIQIRSFAMDYWAELDNQMCYKKMPDRLKMWSVQPKIIPM